MTAPVMRGAEPQSFPGGSDGVLVLHGFTGNPQSMRGLAAAFAAAGYAVELPLLPGHGTSVEDMVPTRWEDYSAAALAAYESLASRCTRVAVVGLSMGGTLATWLAANHPDIVALIDINPAVEPFPSEVVAGLQALIDSGTEVMPAIGSDIADPGAAEAAYEGSPVAPLISLMHATEELALQLRNIRCPLLLFTSPQDHVVPPTSSDFLARSVSGPVERVTLERSYHVATLDYDKEEIESRSVEFLSKVLAG